MRVDIDGPPQLTVTSYNYRYSSFTSHVYFQRQQFSFQTHYGRTGRYEKPAPKTGARKLSRLTRFMAPVSGACVMGIMIL